MKKIKYTPDAADKLRNIKKEISQNYGQEAALDETDRYALEGKSLLYRR